MLKNDRFLVGIVVAVLALVVVAFVLALRQPEPEFRAEGTPDGTVHNYLLALRNRDFARAWSYLSPSVAGYPATVEAFTDDVMSDPASFGLQGTEPATLRVRPAPVESGDSAVVTVDETTFVDNGLVDSGEYSGVFTVHLKRAGDMWQILDVNPQRYWDNCWVEPARDACRWRRPGEVEVTVVAP